MLISVFRWVRAHVIKVEKVNQSGAREEVEFHASYDVVPYARLVILEPPHVQMFVTSQFSKMHSFGLITTQSPGFSNSSEHFLSL
jgi:hypothetical protein